MGAGCVTGCDGGRKVKAEKRMRRVRGWRRLVELKERLREEVAFPLIFN